MTTEHTMVTVVFKKEPNVQKVAWSGNTVMDSTKNQLNKLKVPRQKPKLIKFSLSHPSHCNHEAWSYN